MLCRQILNDLFDLNIQYTMLKNLSFLGSLHAFDLSLQIKLGEITSTLHQSLILLLLCTVSREVGK